MTRDKAAKTSLLPPRSADPGMSDASVTRATGKTWDGWLALLDAWGATGRKHPEIAVHLHEAHGVDGWWAQMVTVGYERARGRRKLHEHADGFSANAGKAYRLDVPTDGSRVAAWFTAKGTAKSAVAIEHGRLRDQEHVAETKASWKARWNRLATVLADD